MSSLLTAPGVSLIAEDSNRSCTGCCMLDRHKQCSDKLTTRGKNIKYTGCFLLRYCAQQGGRHRCRIAADDVTHCAVLTAALRTRCVIIIFMECPELLLLSVKLWSSAAITPDDCPQHQFAVFPSHVVSAGAAGEM